MKNQTNGYSHYGIIVYRTATFVQKMDIQLQISVFVKREKVSFEREF